MRWRGTALRLRSLGPSCRHPSRRRVQLPRSTIRMDSAASWPWTALLRPEAQDSKMRGRRVASGHVCSSLVLFNDHEGLLVQSDNLVTVPQLAIFEEESIP